MTGKPVATDVFGCRFELDPADPFQRGMALEKYEPETMALMRRMLRPGDVYIDCGAQLGYFAALASRCIGPRGRMLLIEPDPRVVGRLRKHLESAPAGEAGAVAICERAVSDGERTAAFTLSGIIGQSSLLPPEKIGNHCGMTQVATTTLDGLLGEHGIERARLLKMDIEGHEPAALRGAARALGEQRFDYIIIEKNYYLLAAANLLPGHLVALFRHYGYAGCHEDGRAFSDESLRETAVDNFIFARDAALLGEVFAAAGDRGGEPGGLGMGAGAGTGDGAGAKTGARGGGGAKTGAGALTLDEARLWREISEDDPVRDRACAIVAQAAGGEVEAAIEAAGELLREHPELADLHGHRAHWLAQAGRVEEAAGEYRALLAVRPGDEEARGRLAELERDGKG